MSDTSTQYLSRSFNCLEAHIEWLKGWDFDVRKLDSGNFSSSLAFILADKIQLANHRFNSLVDQYGMTPNGMVTFAIPVDSRHRFTWFNKELECNHITKFPDNRELDAVARGYFNNYVLSINKDHFSFLVEEYKLSNIPKLIKKGEQSFQIPFQYIRYLSALISELFQTANYSPKVLNDSNFLYKLQFYLPVTLLELLSYSYKPDPIKLTKSELALRNCLDYINKNITKSISAPDLAKEVGASEKTLELVFKKRMGITPKQYIKRTKLNHVRRTLWHSASSGLIDSIARNYGFNHAGQFSADYFKLFNELPSKTRK